jgi:hypothetical protein
MVNFWNERDIWNKSERHCTRGYLCSQDREYSSARGSCCRERARSARACSCGSLAVFCPYLVSIYATVTNTNINFTCDSISLNILSTVMYPQLPFHAALDLICSAFLLQDFAIPTRLFTMNFFFQMYDESQWNMHCERVLIVVWWILKLCCDYTYVVRTPKALSLGTTS